MPHEPGGERVEIHHAWAGRDLGRVSEGDARLSCCGYRHWDSPAPTGKHICRVSAGGCNHHQRIWRHRSRAQYHQEIRRDAWGTHLGGEYIRAGFHILLRHSLAPREGEPGLSSKAMTPSYFLLISTVTVVIASSLTVTSCVTAPRLSCQSWRVYWPGGTLSSINSPWSFVT